MASGPIQAGTPTRKNKNNRQDAFHFLFFARAFFLRLDEVFAGRFPEAFFAPALPFANCAAAFGANGLALLFQSERKIGSKYLAISWLSIITPASRLFRMPAGEKFWLLTTTMLESITKPLLCTSG